MYRRALALLLAASTAAAMAACAPGANDDVRMDVVAGFYPLAYASERIGGPQADVEDLVKPGVEPHDVELTPKQITRIADSDLVVYLDGFQPSLDEAVADHNKDRGFDAALVQPLLYGQAPANEHGDEPGESGHDEHSEVSEDSKGRDPHVWLDPIRYAAIVDALAKRYAEINPANGKKYRTRAGKLRGQLQVLDQDFADGLKTCKTRTFVTSHNAFGYLAERYNLNQVAITGLNPEGEPSPERLAEVTRIARQNKVGTIFFESLVSPKVAKTVASEVGAKTSVLDPIEGVSGKDDYFSVMRTNLKNLRAALGCS